MNFDLTLSRGNGPSGTDTLRANTEGGVAFLGRLSTDYADLDIDANEEGFDEVDEDAVYIVASDDELAQIVTNAHASGLSIGEPRRFVNAYEVDQLYGGPEEGGWYYDAGSPAHPEDFDNEVTSYGPLAEAAAFDLARLFNEQQAANDANNNHRNRTYTDGGPDVIWKAERHEPRGWPTRRPHYE